MKRFMKRFFKILVGIFLFSVYLQIGYWYSYQLARAAYYPSSAAAKVIFPMAPFPNNIEDVPVNTELQEEFGSLEKYYNDQGWATHFVLAMLFPLFQIIVWTFAAISWIMYILAGLFAKAYLF